MKKFALILALPVFLAGCTTTFESGKAFDMTCVDQFKVGVTTKADAVRCLGEPNLVKQSQSSADRELLVWVHSTTSGAAFGKMETQSQSLGLIFVDGKYEGVHVREKSKI